MDRRDICRAVGEVLLGAIAWYSGYWIWSGVRCVEMNHVVLRVWFWLCTRVVTGIQHFSFILCCYFSFL